MIDCFEIGMKVWAKNPAVPSPSFELFTVVQELGFNACLLKQRHRIADEYMVYDGTWTECYPDTPEIRKLVKRESKIHGKYARDMTLTHERFRKVKYIWFQKHNHSCPDGSLWVGENRRIR